jgi:hypothetical protein
VNKRDHLIAKFAPRSRRSGKIVLFDAATAEEIIAEAQLLGVRVLGLDAFLVTEEGIQPLQQYELDVETGIDPHGQSIRYLRDFAVPGVMFEIAFDTLETEA